MENSRLRVFHKQKIYIQQCTSVRIYGSLRSLPCDGIQCSQGRVDRVLGGGRLFTMKCAICFGEMADERGSCTMECRATRKVDLSDETKSQGDVMIARFVARL